MAFRNCPVSKRYTLVLYTVCTHLHCDVIIGGKVQIKMASLRGVLALRQLSARSQALVPRRFVHVENSPGNVSLYSV